MANREDKRKRGEREFWSKVAPRYDSWIVKAFEDQYEIYKSRLATYLKPEDNVLEIGSGTGEITFHLAKKCGEITGIDISPEMVTAANKKKAAQDVNNVTFQTEDAYKLSFGNAYFDKVICVNALQTMKEPERAVAEGKRVLKAGGEFITITYCYADSGFVEKLKLIKWVVLYGLPKYWHNFRCREITDLFKRERMEILEKERVWKKPAVQLVRAGK